MSDIPSMRQKGFTRSTTIGVGKNDKPISTGRVADAMYPAVDVDRPKTRAECCGGSRPCPFVGCKHNLYLDINPDTGSIKINFPDLEPWEMTADKSCALDVADLGGITLEEVGAIMNITRERVRQIEVRGLIGLKRQPISEDL